MGRTKVVKMADLTPPQQHLVQALLAAKQAKVTDPVALAKLAPLLSDALRKHAEQ